MNIHFFFSGTKEKKGTPGQKGNPGHFAMKFVNLRNRERQPSFVTIKVPDIKVCETMSFKESNIFVYICRFVPWNECVLSTDRNFITEL